MQTEGGLILLPMLSKQYPGLSILDVTFGHDVVVEHTATLGNPPVYYLWGLLASGGLASGGFSDSLEFS